MCSSPRKSKSTAVLCLLVSHVYSQTLPSASLLTGGGAPGAAPYQLVDVYQPADMLAKFTFFDKADPSHGHVQYVNESIAVANGYASVGEQGGFILKPETSIAFPGGGLGIPSVRIVSQNTYNHGLFILDLNHIPTGCGTWPAYWLLGPNWPYNGEIDIIEGVHYDTEDSVSMHTSPGCTIAGSGQTGALEYNDCDTSQNNNAGCGVTLSDPPITNNYGAPFNLNGGGVYATEWTSEYVQTWFFPRGSIPSTIYSASPDPSTFGTPVANHQGACDIDAHFQNMSIVLNVDFCGDWAGNVYSQYDMCPQGSNVSVSSLTRCVNYVGSNPAALSEAYFDINSLYVYQMPADVAPVSTYSTSLSSVTPTASANTIPLGMGATTSSLSSVAYSGPISSSTSSAAVSQPTSDSGLVYPSNPCPTQGARANYTDSGGAPYEVYCGGQQGWISDPAGELVVAQSFDNCMALCDAKSGCAAVIYDGANDSGICYLKLAGGFEGDSVIAWVAVRVEGVVPEPSVIEPSSIASMTSLVVKDGVTSTAILPVMSSLTPVASTLTCVPSGIFTQGPQAPAAACGTDFADICSGSTGAATICTSDGNTYSINCNQAFVGTEIDDSQIGDLLVKRITADTFAACQTYCETTSTCVAVNYVGTECTLFSQITGVTNTAGAVNAAEVADNEPSCPGSDETTIVDDYGYGYHIECGAAVLGNDIGSPTFAAGISECLPLCDQVVGCLGVQYSSAQRTCNFKSSEDALASYGNSIIFAGRIIFEETTTTSPSSIASATSTSTALPPANTISPTSTTTAADNVGSITTTSTSTSTPSTPISVSIIPSTSSQATGLPPSQGISSSAIVLTPANTTSAYTSTITTWRGTCPNMGTTTLFTTHTITSCGVNPVCPKPTYLVV